MKRVQKVLVGGLLVAVGCATGTPPEFRGDPPMDFPEPGAVDAVVFLVGDAGAATRDNSPVLSRLSADVEYWAELLERDSAVTVAFLGDNVYPVGIRDRNHPEFAADSARLWSQVSVLSGPFARERGAAGYFLAGNHDWGNTTGEAGVLRLENQAALLDSARADGVAVAMVPEPGDPGPWVNDVRTNVRLMVMDTHWFLQSPTAQARTEFFLGVYEAMVAAEDRHLILMAHHPYHSAGPHGLLTPGDQGFGLLYLMRKSGTLVQDLNSPIYSDFLQRLDATFEQVGRPPLVFAGGHDHSLQVLDPDHEGGPETVLVSGAGSKLTPVADSPSLRYAASRPGYMMLIFRRNEAVDLYVVAAPTADPTCPEGEGVDRDTCMAQKTAGIALVYAERLAPEASLPDTSSVAPNRR